MLLIGAEEGGVKIEGRFRRVIDGGEVEKKGACESMQRAEEKWMDFWKW